MTPVMFENLDQVDLLKKEASEHDIVINSASAFRALGARALIEGLAERKKKTGEPAWFIHVSDDDILCQFAVNADLLL